MAAKVKKGDRVIVTAGRNKGVQGEVLKVLPSENRVVVQGINVVKRHQKPGQMDPGGIKTFEAPIHVSNVAIMDPRDGKPTRVGFKLDEHG
ncbi:MAG: 50S ribosomal protein L24, partial [Henriciella sp.]|uniref:50S ribosomal protein L24 n=1 Tax=Henriciella sp. TaxID=1968823 RepID=UPI003C7382C5